MANEPDGLSKALVKTIEYRADIALWIEEFIFYDHPSVEHRVRAAMDWKAAHMNLRLRAIDSTMQQRCRRDGAVPPLLLQVTVRRGERR